MKRIYKGTLYLGLLGITALAAFLSLGGGKDAGRVTLGPNEANADVPYSQSGYYSETSYYGESSYSSGGGTDGAAAGGGASCDGSAGGDCGDGGGK